MKMNVTLTKLISSAAAVLAVGSTSYAQQKSCAPTPAPCCFEQGYEICNDKFPAAYNAAARIDVQCSWDLFATASFLYWYADQEAMDLALPIQGTVNGQVLIQDFDFKPGFKVGLGVNFDHDNWVGFVEYTWFHQTNKTGLTEAPADTSWLPSWFQSRSSISNPTVGSQWRLNMDIVDATLSRPFYQGRKLTVLPFGGLRGAWIRQNMKVEALQPAGVEIEAATFLSKNHSHSWAVGPRAGFQAHWMLGWGFRIEGDAAASLLFTRYTKVTHNETEDDVSNVYASFHDYNTVRPMADMGIGFGWGSYFDRQNYHFDLVATYDFNVMWGQNMMRELAMQTNGIAFEAADLHLQGLTATARFDF
jgi:hypothetical protein